jgi:hypothetical protein
VCVQASALSVHCRGPPRPQQNHQQNQQNNSLEGLRGRIFVRSPLVANELIPIWLGTRACIP